MEPSDVGLPPLFLCQVPDAYKDLRFNRERDEKSGLLTRNVLSAPLRQDTLRRTAA
jgi:hypothetical protein